MRLILAAVGRMKKGPEQELCNRYLERARAGARHAGFSAIELREIPESQARDADARAGAEAKALLAATAPGARLALLDERGKPLNSKEFTAEISTARDMACDIVLALGGPDGHGREIRERADLIISFGAMTWPHQLARIMAAEQIYRATTLLTGHPYHRG